MNNIDNRMEQLQIFRFVAFMLVYFCHVPMFRFKFFPSEDGSLVGLEFFLLLSGFLAVYSLYHKADIPVTKENVFNYVKKKVIKFYPLYFITNLIAVSYSELPSNISNHNFKGAGLDFLTLLKDLFLLKSWIPWRIFSHNGATWYISCILFLSLLNIPINHWVCSFIKKDNASKKLMIMLASAIAYMCIMHLSVLIWGIQSALLNSPLFRLGDYIAGMALGYIAVLYKEKHPLNENQKNYTLFESIILVFWFLSFSAHINGIITIVSGYLMDILLIFIFAIGYGNVSQALKAKPLVLIGNITFECYMIHQVIIYIYCNYNGWENYTRSGKVFGFMFCLLITICIAAYLNKKTSFISLNNK